MPELTLEDGFLARLHELSETRRRFIETQLVVFLRDPESRHLRLRPLRCRANHYLIDGLRGDRVILRRETETRYVAVDCGGHDIIDEWEALLRGT